MSTNAQTKVSNDYFTGQWRLLAVGTPGGDSEMIVSLERKEGKLTGMVKIGDENELRFFKIEEKETSVILNFISNHGYDVKLFLEYKDANHIAGTITIIDIGEGSITGERIIKK